MNLLCKKCENKIDKRSITGYCKNCFHVETRSTHGMSRTRFYKTWGEMNYRCADKPKSSNYKHYFLKGICVLWDNFEDFMYDMYDGYVKLSEEIGEKNVTIERENYNLNYYKENCIRIHKNEQSKNKSNNKYYKYNGISDTLAGRSKRIGINRLTLYSRIHDSGWDLEKTFSTLETNRFGIKKSI